jgi:uncharacterized membrane protein
MNGFIAYGLLGIFSLIIYFTIARKLGHRIVSAILAALIISLVPQINFFFQHGYWDKFFLVGFVVVFVFSLIINVIARFAVYLKRHS